jgi:hypothetical protein
MGGISLSRVRIPRINSDVKITTGIIRVLPKPWEMGAVEDFDELFFL